MTITQTCRTCGGDNVTGLRPTGPTPDAARKAAALSTVLEEREAQVYDLGCRVAELEQAIRAFCTGSVQLDVLRKVVGAEAL